MHVLVHRIPRLHSPAGDSRSVACSLSLASAGVRLGLERQGPAENTSLTDLVNRHQAQAVGTDGHASYEEGARDGRPFARRRTELTSGDGVRLVRIEQFWVDDGELWRAWAIAPPSDGQDGDGRLLGLVDMLMDANTSEPRPERASWAAARETWNEVRSSF